MMRKLYCCKLTSFVIGVGCVFLAAQTALLILCILLIGNTRAALPVFDWIEDRAEEELWTYQNATLSTNHGYFQRKLGDFLAIPITINLVLMMANGLLIWAAVAKHRLLLWPWIVLYAVEWIAMAAGVVYMVIAIRQDNAKVLAFLVSCPFLVVFGFCWLAVKSLDNYLGEMELKEAVAAVYNKTRKKSELDANSVKEDEEVYPATVYSCAESNHHQHHQRQWDQPLPIWATLPARAVWDPYYIQQYDPRYAVPGRQVNNGYYGGQNKSKSKKTCRSRRLSPTRLPDGTLVVPISEETPNEDEDDEDLSQIREENEEASNTSTRKNGKSRHHHRRHRHRSGGGASSSLSLTRSCNRSEASSSVISLSDKYRQQEEVEVFEEFYPTVMEEEDDTDVNETKHLPTPPKPIMPMK